MQIDVPLDDTEDTTYEDSNEFKSSASSDDVSEEDIVYKTLGITDKNSGEIDFLHSILVHRYDREIQKMHSLKTQSVFILTALGFLITLALGILGADWFSFSIFSIPDLIFVFGYSIPIAILSIISAYHAWTSMSRIDGYVKKESEYCWDYPDDRLIEKSMSSVPEIEINKRVLCRTLAYTIDHNYRNNQMVKLKLRKSMRCLFLAFLYSLVIVIFIIICGYFSSPDSVTINAENASIYTNTILSIKNMAI